MLESTYQARLISKIEKLLPGCEILKNDAKSRQGICDLAIFYQDSWAMLEVKVSADAPQQPNQEYYVNRFNEMSFAAFIFPENEEEVLHALQQSFESRRPARLSRR